MSTNTEGDIQQKLSELSGKERTYLYSHADQIIDVIMNSEEEKMAVKDMDIEYQNKSEIGYALRVFSRLYDQDLSHYTESETKPTTWDIGYLRRQDDLEELQDILDPFSE